MLPLATRMRPQSLEHFIGQEHLLAPKKALYEMVKHQQLHSMVLWGPPGSGKTSLAKLLATAVNSDYLSISAATAGKDSIRKLVNENLKHPLLKKVLFIDEVHRFNKIQQDVLLPYIEQGDFIFIGATTENPSFELTNALLSRVSVYPLRKLTDNNLRIIAAHAQQKGFGKKRISITKKALDLIINYAIGDARKLLNILEISSHLGNEINGVITIDETTLDEINYGIQNHRFDKKGDIFYEQISALHKSVRGSDPDASIYWLLRMLEGGCDPLYIARRLVRIASEDIGNADPLALRITLDAWDVQLRIGKPEGDLALVQAVIYLACADKSNAAYLAYKAALKQLRNTPDYPVPNHLCNAPTELLKRMGKGYNYRYPHDEEHAYAAGECYFPPELQGQRYYHPVARGLERSWQTKLANLNAQDTSSKKQRYR